MQEIYFGAGCFWGSQAYFDKIKGVVKTEVGYLNGNKLDVSYEEVCNNSGHVEVVKVIYDEKLIHPLLLFEAYIRIVDPYSINKQGNDVGIQYRSGIYAKDKSILDSFKIELTKWEQNNMKSAIELKLVNDYTSAEEYHQKYLIKNPKGYCHINLLDIPKNLIKR